MEEILLTFIEYLQKEKKSSKNTILSYTRDVREFFTFLKESDIDDVRIVNRTNLISYLYQLEKQKKASSTISRSVASLRAFYHFLELKGEIQENPALDIMPPKTNRKIPIIPSKEQIALLLIQPDTRSPKGKRDKAILELLYATGIRVSELISLQVDDVNLLLSYIRCKVKNKNRIIPIGTKAKEALVLYLEQGRKELSHTDTEKTLFLNYNGKSMSRQGIWKMIKRYALQADIEEDVTPHTLRHAFAAHLIENGADIHAVQEMMGHADISTTQIYTKRLENKLKVVYNQAHPRA